VRNDTHAMLTLDEVRFGFPGQRIFLGPVTLSIERGQCWAIVGPNGAGKSTLLRLMAGLYKAHTGSVRLSGAPLAAIAGRERAKRIAFVSQHAASGFDLTVHQIVLMGRFPHRSFGLFESKEDQKVAERALELTGIHDLADRPIKTLSGGEAQRVHIAAAIAQMPQVMLLDEPTASLDLKHQLAIFRLLRDRAWREGLAVVVVTHDVNLAAQYCSHVVLLNAGKVAALGQPEDVVMPEVLSPVYGVELTTLAVAGAAGRQWVVPTVDVHEGAT